MANSSQEVKNITEGINGNITETENEDDSSPPTSQDIWEHFFSISISIFFYLGDIFGDIYLVYFYHNSDQSLYFWLTLTFLIVPMIVTSFLSLVWYNRDSNRGNGNVPKASKGMWLARILFALFGFAPFLRYIMAFTYGVKSYKAIGNTERSKKYYKFMKKEDADYSFLRLFEAFLEAAPQLTLQLVIVLKEFSGNYSLWTFETARLVGAFISLATAIAGFNRASRLSEGKQVNPSWRAGHIIHLFWHMFTISARVFALAIFASSYPIAMIIASLTHWVFMLIWLSVQDCLRNKTWSWVGSLLKLVTGFIYLFTFFSVHKGTTRYLYSVFYSIIFIENFGMILICFEKYEVVTSLLILLGDVILFTVGIAFMLIFYKVFHPVVGDLTCCGLSCRCLETADGESDRQNILRMPILC